jgi:hypothetical protein
MLGVAKLFQVFVLAHDASAFRLKCEALRRR